MYWLVCLTSHPDSDFDPEWAILTRRQLPISPASHVTSRPVNRKAPHATQMLTKYAFRLLHAIRHKFNTKYSKRKERGIFLYVHVMRKRALEHLLKTGKIDGKLEVVKCRTVRKKQYIRRREISRTLEGHDRVRLQQTRNCRIRILRITSLA